MSSPDLNPANTRIPVTVLTGFLGAGKTTLLNRILTEHHGQRIAVIENEFGEIGIDQALVIDADEEIFEMNNGCICCTVRGDLIRILTSLMRRRDRFDAVLIETTGLADPAPVAQTFFVDEEIAEHFRLDGIVTLVDAHHIALHLEDSHEAREQIAFADVIILNKIDRMDVPARATLEQRLRGMNALASIHHAVYANVPLETVLNIGGFDLNRILQQSPDFLEPEYPFEWAGLYRLQAGLHTFRVQSGPDQSLRLLIQECGSSEADMATWQGEAQACFKEMPVQVDAGGNPLIETGCLYELALTATPPMYFDWSVTTDGDYVLFTEHHPVEFDIILLYGGKRQLPLHEWVFKPDHRHDEQISSVGLTAEGDIDHARFNNWLGELLREKGMDIFRAKGILSIRGQDKQLVFHTVHMLMDSQTGQSWGKASRHNQLIFIGRNLDRVELTRGFEACRVAP